MVFRTVGAVIVIASLSSLGIARQPDVFDACARTKDDAARLACFDRAVASRQAAVSAAVAPTTARTPPSSRSIVSTRPAPTANPGAGLDAPQPRENPRERRVTESARPAAIAATVVRVIPRGPYISAFELDNGQIWQQSEAVNFWARPREKVTIRPGVLGSFFLKNADGAEVRVHRVR